MNKLSTNLAATLIVLLVAFFVGRLLFLSGTQIELEQAKSRLEQSLASQKILEAEHEKLQKSIAAAPTPTKGNKLITRGDEPLVLRFMLEKLQKSFRLNNYELLDSYRIKPEISDSYSSPSFSEAPEQLQQLDEHGMPVGLQEETDEEWPGVEIIPVKFSFASTYRSFGMMLTEAGKSLPMHAIRSMDLVLSRSGTLRGTVVMTFPVAEARKR